MLIPGALLGVGLPPGRSSRRLVPVPFIGLPGARGQRVQVAAAVDVPELVILTLQPERRRIAVPACPGKALPAVGE
eukprot:3159859-Alexandrium_andersonii.AAC.1